MTKIDTSHPSEKALIDPENQLSDTGDYDKLEKGDIESHGKERVYGLDVASLAQMNAVRLQM